MGSRAVPRVPKSKLCQQAASLRDGDGPADLARSTAEGVGGADLVVDAFCAAGSILGSYSLAYREIRNLRPNRIIFKKSTLLEQEFYANCKLILENPDGELSLATFHKESPNRFIKSKHGEGSDF